MQQSRRLRFRGSVSDCPPRESHLYEAFEPAEYRRQGGRMSVARLVGRSSAKLFAFLAVLLTLGFAADVFAATLPGGFAETRVATGLANPTAMAIAPDGRVFVAQQGGALRVIKNGALLSQPFLTVSVNASGERGLLGIAFDPQFATNN